MYRKGKLYFRYGTMGSAKTALLLTTAYNFEERPMSYLCMKPAIDTREGDRVIHSRIGIERACEWIYPDTDLYRFAKNYFKKEGKLVDWFLVDEAQFLSEQQVDQLSRIVDDFGCNVICYGLRTDFQSHLFEGSRRLFEIADTIDEIKSTCNCGRKTDTWPYAASAGAINASSKAAAMSCPWYGMTTTRIDPYRDTTPTYNLQNDTLYSRPTDCDTAHMDAP